MSWNETTSDKTSDKTAVATSLEKHALSGCPRCGTLFLCRVNAPCRCDCADVPLSAEERDYVLLLADGECVCAECLARLRAEYRVLHGF